MSGYENRSDCLLLGGGEVSRENLRRISSAFQEGKEKPSGEKRQQEKKP